MEKMKNALDVTNQEEKRKLLMQQLTEKQWPMWILSIGDIIDVSQYSHITLWGKDRDVIARITKKGIECGVADVWRLCIENALRDVESEYTFSISEVHEIDRSDDLIKYEGILLLSSPYEKEPLPVKFQFSHDIINNENITTLTRDQDVIMDDHWDVLEMNAEDFLISEYNRNKFLFIIK